MTRRIPPIAVPRIRRGTGFKGAYISFRAWCAEFWRSVSYRCRKAWDRIDLVCEHPNQALLILFGPTDLGMGFRVRERAAHIRFAVARAVFRILNAMDCDGIAACGGSIGFFDVNAYRKLWTGRIVRRRQFATTFPILWPSVTSDADALRAVDQGRSAKRVFGCIGPPFPGMLNWLRRDHRFFCERVAFSLQRQDLLFEIGQALPPEYRPQSDLEWALFFWCDANYRFIAAREGLQRLAQALRVVARAEGWEALTSPEQLIAIHREVTPGLPSIFGWERSPTDNLGGLLRSMIALDDYMVYRGVRLDDPGRPTIATLMRRAYKASRRGDLPAGDQCSSIWGSGLRSVCIGEFRFVPLRSTHALTRAAKSLDNCLDSPRYAKGSAIGVFEIIAVLQRRDRAPGLHKRQRSTRDLSLLSWASRAETAGRPWPSRRRIVAAIEVSCLRLRDGVPTIGPLVGAGNNNITNGTVFDAFQVWSRMYREGQLTKRA